MLSIPNLNGQKFRIKEQFIQSGIHNVDSPESKTYICKFKQKGSFVSSTDAKKNECLGVWNHTSGKWQLYLSIDKNDSHVFILTPKKILENNVITEMEGILIEFGTSKGYLLKSVDAIYNAMPSNLKKNMIDFYNIINSSLRKKTNQILKVAHMTIKRIE